jgi:hypothetical protein
VESVARIADFLWIVGVFRLFLGIEVTEVAEEFVEAMLGRQKFILVPEVILAELACRITLDL